MQAAGFLRGRLGVGALLSLLSLLVYSATLNGVWSTDHTQSFLELDYAMWAHHSFALGPVGSFNQTVDDFAYNGNYFTALAPGTAIFALPFVGPGILLDRGFALYGYANLFSEFFVALMNALAVLFTFRLAKLFIRESAAAFVALAYGFSTISWPFATFFFQSDVSAGFAVIAVYFALRKGSDLGGVESLIISGVAAGAALMVDYVTAVLVPVLLLYVIAVSWRRGRGTALRDSIAFLVGPLAGVCAIGTYNLVNFGSAFVSSEQLYLHSSTLLGNFTTPVYLGIYLNTITPLRGLLFFSPVVLLGFFGFRRMLSRRLGVAREGVLLLAVFLALFLPYCAWYGPEGGLSFGARFIIPSLPFLLVPAGFVLEEGKRWRFVMAYTLYSAGAAINGLAAVTSALAPVRSWLTSPFLDSTVPLLQQGVLDQWWRGRVGGYWPVAVGSIIAIALALPLVAQRWRRVRAAYPATTQTLAEA